MLAGVSVPTADMLSVRCAYTTLVATIAGLVQLQPVNGQLYLGTGDCDPNPCQNGGDCTPFLVFYICTCTNGFTGLDCRDQVCGINPAAPASPRYFGGSDAPLGKWPWQGYIKLSRGINYGTTLIAPQWAVTSANFDFLSTRSAFQEVVFGDIYQGDQEDMISDYRQVATVQEIVRFPGVNFYRFDGTVMLLKFTEPLSINDYVRPICLPSADVDETAYYDICYSAGWGLNEDSEFNTNLTEGRATIVDLETCISNFRDINGTLLPNENMICSGQMNTADGPCLGDGGNAIACSADGVVWDMVGVVSWGYDCGGELPGVNWRTTAFLDFINYVAFDGPQPADLCEPLEVEECASYLPYAETYVNQQDGVLSHINSIVEFGAQFPLCDLEELQGVVCANHLLQCNPGDGGQMVICRDYCENVEGRCGLENSILCDFLPYAANYSQKWCTRGEDYSCGSQSIPLTLPYPVRIVSPLYPETYPELRNCRWDISAPVGYVIQVKYRHVNINPDSDYLAYGEGDPDLLTSILYRVDGDVAPPIWKSSSNEMWISFQSNGIDGDIGFELYVTPVPEEGRDCEESDVFCDDDCYPDYIRCDFVDDCVDGSDEYGCNNFTLTNDSVIIESPLYPVPGYPPNFDFTWTFAVQEPYLIGLHFDDFNLDVGGGDYVLVGEGSGGGMEDALYILSGNMDSLHVLPFASNVWLRLITDDVRDGGRGFRTAATPELVPGECFDYEFDCRNGICLLLDVACDGVVQCANGADEENCPVGRCEIEDVEIPPEERCNQIRFCLAGEDEIGCDLAQVGEKFYFTVPRNKSNTKEYISDAILAWIIRAEEGLGFAVRFDEFSIEQDYDLLYIGSTPEDPNQLEQFTGRIPPEPFFIEDNTFSAIFLSDADKNIGAVTFGVEVVNLDDVFTCEKGNRLNSKQQICDGLWHCPDGSDEFECYPLPRFLGSVIVTPRFPLPYENNAAVTWTFKAEEGSRIIFHASSFDTEEGYDTLRIGSGLGCRENYFVELSGYHNPDPVLSEDNTLCLHFSSDQTITSTGIFGFIVAVTEEDYVECPEDGSVAFLSQVCDNEWHCTVTGVDESDCDVFGEGDYTTICNPSSDYYYEDNTNVTYVVRAEQGLVLLVNFTSFQTEQLLDTVTIGNGDDPSDIDSQIVEVSGFVIPAAIITDGNALWLRFTSNENSNYAGFCANISAVATAGN